MAVYHRRKGEPPWTPPPPFPDQVTIVGENETYNRENLVQPFFWYTNFWVPEPPPALPPFEYFPATRFLSVYFFCFAA